MTYKIIVNFFTVRASKYIVYHCDVRTWYADALEEELCYFTSTRNNCFAFIFISYDSLYKAAIYVLIHVLMLTKCVFINAWVLSGK